jgi:2-oxoglutarate ferredoxin oxidoreductase subunit beta
MAESKMTHKDYISSLKPIWCPGCGDFAVLNAVAKALATMELPNEKVAVVSGIGCSSRLPGYLNTYGFNAIHGRALPIAAGLKLSRPDVTVLAVGGDGDIFSIGGNHLPHVARRNIDLTCIVMDNGIYGLTKGQVSPTTPIGEKTITTVYGSIEDPIQPLKLLLSYEASFVAQSTSLDLNHLVATLVAAMRHKGFSFVNVRSPCVTYRGKEQYDIIRQRSKYIDQLPDYDPTDMRKAWHHAITPEYISLGILYQNARDTYDQRQTKIRETAKGNRDWSINDVMQGFML